MNSSDEELIQQYLLGTCTDGEVAELERRLLADSTLREQYVLETEIESCLRIEAESLPVKTPLAGATSGGSWRGWMPVSGMVGVITVVVALAVILGTVGQKPIQAHPSLGELPLGLAVLDGGIFAAAAEGDLRTLQQFIAQGEAVDIRSRCGLTALHIATLCNRPMAVGLLLANGADVSFPDREGNTPLHMAAFFAYESIVEVLLAGQADPRLRNHLGFSVTDTVAIEWSAGLEEYYLSVSEESQIAIDLGRIRARRAAIKATLIAAVPERIPASPELNIFQAAITGNTRLLQQHIDAGTDLNAREEYGGSTPLILGSIYNQVDTVRQLLQAGANIDLQNANGGTSLHHACFFCNPNVVEILLENGADTDVKDRFGHTALSAMTADFDEDTEKFYVNAYEALKIPFDADDVRRKRPLIAELIRKHLADSSDPAPRNGK